eukprot:Skav225640  [mRNA]  locus=scaffold1716:264996:265862:- [translate_table: standard]
MGDYQTHVEHYLHSFDLQGDVLLLDLALSPAHDVTNVSLVKKLLQWVREGYIIAALLAPPCETWSQVRFLQDDTPAPRPLRSRSNPLCLEGLSAEELRQLAVANFLLMVAIRVLLACSLSEVPCLCEHPKEPSHSEKPSIWRLPWLVHLQSEGMIRRHVLFQAAYGASSAKPTNFAECHCPSYRRSLKELSQKVCWEHLELLQGRRSDGSWMTGSAKEYPLRLNQALALTHVREHLRLTQRGALCKSRTEAFQQEFASLYAGDLDWSAQELRPDYGHRDRDTVMDCMD